MLFFFNQSESNLIRWYVKPAQRARVDDAEALDCRYRVDGYANTSRRRVERPGEKTRATHRRGIVFNEKCKK